MTRRAPAAVLGAALLLGACTDRLQISNPNAPSEEGAAAAPQAAIRQSIIGVLSTFRDNQGGYLTAVGNYGREIYNITPTDGRNVTGFYRDWQQNNSFGAGPNWAARYGNLRNIFAVRALLDATPVLTTQANAAADRAGVDGVLRTFEAWEFLVIINTRFNLGAPTQLSASFTEIFPFQSRDSVFNYIANTLDAGATNLTAATTPFVFAVNAGFAGFNTPTTFRQVNRALKARVEAYRASHLLTGAPTAYVCGATCQTRYQAALTALTESFIPATLSATNRVTGPSAIFSAAPGDVLNGVSLQNPFLFIHPSLDAVAGVTTDPRYVAKTVARNRSPIFGVSATRGVAVYANNTASIPYIRAEELYFLRAEARYFTGDAPGALADINAIRATYGLAARGAFASADDFVTTLLAERRLSLLFEGHRWIDHRRFGRLAELGTLAQDVAAGFTVAPQQVVPQLECDVRRNSGEPALAGPGCP